MAPTQVFLTLPEAADFLRISRSALYRHMTSGLIPARKLGRRVLVARADLERMAEGLPRANVKTAA